MTEENLKAAATAAETFARKPNTLRNMLRRRQLSRTEWMSKDLPFGGTIFQLRERARKAQSRAGLFLGLLYLSVIAGVVYFVAEPVLRDWLASQRANEREKDVAALEVRKAQLDGRFETLQAGAVSIALEEWRRRNISADLRSLSFVDAQTGWVGGSGRTVLRTQDGGQTWTRQNPGTQDTIYSIYFIDQSTGWVGGADGMFKTVDGGANWTKVDLNSNQEVNGLFFLDDTTGWAAADNLNTFATESEQPNWNRRQLVRSNGTQPHLWAVDFVNETNGWIVGSRAALFQTTNGGETWNEQEVPDGVDADFQSFLGVDFVNITHGWAVGEEGLIVRTSDAGDNWVIAERPGSQSLQDVYFLDRDFGWIVGGNGLVMRTDNGGETWSSESIEAATTLFGVDFADQDVGWVVGASSGVWSTVNGGETWQNLSSNLVASPLGTDWFGAEIERADSATTLEIAMSAQGLILPNANKLKELVNDQVKLAEDQAKLPLAARSLAEQALIDATELIYKARFVNAEGTAEHSDESTGKGSTEASSESTRPQQFELEKAKLAFDAAMEWKEHSDVWWADLDQRIPAGVLLLFFLATLSSLYRYNTRIAGFYHARADALELLAHQFSYDKEEFEQLVGTLAADRVEFKHAKTPADMATELIKEMIGKLNLKPTNQ